MLLLDNEITAPPVGAGATNLIVPVEEVPSTKIVGETPSENGGTAPRLRKTFALPPPEGLCSQATYALPPASSAIDSGLVGK